jgi:Uncharacterized conserved protein
MDQLSFLTVAKAACCEINIEHSRFIGHCFESGKEDQAKSFLAQIRAQHSQATHNCYAYRINAGAYPLEYFNDNGEPGGTAGKPILGAIQRLNLLNVIVVVTRYFGGKKLGVRGLIEAYGQAATLVLEQAGTVLRVPRFSVSLIYPYSVHSNILYRMRQLEGENTTTRFQEMVQSEFSIPTVHHGSFLELLKELPEVKVLTISNHQ